MTPDDSDNDDHHHHHYRHQHKKKTQKKRRYKTGRAEGGTNIHLAVSVRIWRPWKKKNSTLSRYLQEARH